MALSPPEGPISKIAERLDFTIRATHLWGTLSGAKVFHNHLPLPSDRIRHTLNEIQQFRPFVLIWTDDDEGIRWRRDTARGGACVESRGRLVIRFERNVPPQIAPDEADRSWENLIGRLAKGTAAEPGLMDLAGDVRYLPITQITLDSHARTDPKSLKDIGDAQIALLSVEWSTE